VTSSSSLWSLKRHLKTVANSSPEAIQATCDLASAASVILRFYLCSFSEINHHFDLFNLQSVLSVFMTLCRPNHIRLIIGPNGNNPWCESTTNPVPALRLAASRGFTELTKNVIRSSHGHSTPSLKISCKLVQPFSRNLANKETKKIHIYKQRNQSKTIPRPPMYRGRGVRSMGVNALQTWGSSPFPLNSPPYSTPFSSLSSPSSLLFPFNVARGRERYKLPQRVRTELCHQTHIGVF